MALSKIDAANFLTGTIPSGNIATSSLAAAATGKVLQVVTATDSTTRSTTSTSFVTASNTLSVNITPSSTSSKIFIIVTATGYNSDGNDNAYTIYRDSTNLGGSDGLVFVQHGVPGSNAAQSSVAMSTLDSPSSSSQITYQVYYRRLSTGTAELGRNNAESTITAFEIAG